MHQPVFRPVNPPFASTAVMHGVTGVLLHQGGNFFQYLEGPEKGVAQVYARVQKATSHHGLIEIVNGPVDQRHFTAWTMGFAEAARSDLK